MLPVNIVTIHIHKLGDFYSDTPVSSYLDPFLIQGYVRKTQ